MKLPHAYQSLAKHLIQISAHRCWETQWKPVNFLSFALISVSLESVFEAAPLSSPIITVNTLKHRHTLCTKLYDHHILVRHFYQLWLNPYIVSIISEDEMVVGHVPRRISDIGHHYFRL